MADLFPVFVENQLVDGTYIKLTSFCNSKFPCDKCHEFYLQLQKQPSGFYQCPYGMTAYVYCLDNNQIIYTGLRVKKYYTKKPCVSDHDKLIYNPVMNADDLLPLLQKNAEANVKIAAVDDLLHETRKLNSQIKANCDLIFEEESVLALTDNESLYERVTNIHVSSYMIYNRFAHFDTVLNPKLATGAPMDTVVFKKFDKMRKLLKGYQKKNVWITLNSNSFYSYSVYSTFETLLFILFENAIKYSPKNKPINVDFSEEGDILDITIDSIGPYCDENELLHLSDKGFRGREAKLADNSGQGFGLTFAVKICERHGIGISFNSTYSHRDHGIHYGHFIIQLHFDKSKK